MREKSPADLLVANSAWAEAKTRVDPNFFTRLCEVQRPRYLWIGCSDSRVPANEIVDLQPGELFVHRNVANVVAHSDLNCLAVLQYAIEILKVRHVIVTGHYGCGGISAAMSNQDHGQIENWLAPIKDIYHQHHDEIDSITGASARANRLCELNVMAQVRNVARTTIVQRAWRNGNKVTIHGWIYSLQNGILQDLGVRVSAVNQLPEVYRFTSTQSVLGEGT